MPTVAMQWLSKLLKAPDGIWTIVEFKTDEVHGGDDFADLLRREDYRDQATRYASAGERLLGQRPQVILCMLNYAGRIELRPTS